VGDLPNKRREARLARPEETEARRDRMLVSRMRRIRTVWPAPGSVSRGRLRWTRQSSSGVRPGKRRRKLCGLRGRSDERCASGQPPRTKIPTLAQLVSKITPDNRYPRFLRAQKLERKELNGDPRTYRSRTDWTACFPLLAGVPITAGRQSPRLLLWSRAGAEVPTARAEGRHKPRIPERSASSVGDPNP